MFDESGDGKVSVKGDVAQINHAVGGNGTAHSLRRPSVENIRGIPEDTTQSILSFLFERMKPLDFWKRNFGRID